MQVFTVDVGFTTTRPVVPDQHMSRVRVAAENAVEAQMVAAQMVGAHAEMVTSTNMAI